MDPEAETVYSRFILDLFSATNAIQPVAEVAVGLDN